jgi:two-component sensor histidine kinase
MTRPRPSFLRTRARHLAFAFASVVVATGLSVLFDARLDMRGPTALLFYFAAITLSAGLGGLWPGMLATILATASADYFFIKPFHSVLIFKRDDALQLAVYFTIGLLISGLSERLQMSLRRAEIARDEAEAARRRLAFLAEASAALDMSMDYRDNLARLARKAVPSLADWCAVDLIGPDGTITNLAAAHRDPEMDALVRELNCRYPLDPSGAHPIMKALKTGRSDIYLDISDSTLVASARDEAHLDLLRRLQVRSYLCVPLHGRHGVIGTLLFAHAARNRYAESDRAMAEDLARRAALAMENASLFQEAQEEIAVRKATEEALERKQEEVEALNTRLRRAMIETHHRVKNNLQIITAMVDMRLMDGDKTIPVEEIAHLGSYIKTLAAVHDILTLESREAGEPQDVSARAILEKLLPLMQETGAGRRIAYRLEEARLPAKLATSLALVVNELISNAMKYGRGDIEVELRVEDSRPEFVSQSPQTLVLSVCDDGPGFPPDFDPVSAANTGLELVDNLSRWDLGGSARFENRPAGGAKVVVHVPLKPAARLESPAAVVTNSAAPVGPDACAENTRQTDWARL